MKFKFWFQGIQDGRMWMFVWPNFQLPFLSLGGLHCWLINKLHGLSFNKVGWLGFGLLQGTRCIVSVGSPSFELEIERHFFCWIPCSSRNFLVKFHNFSQSVELVGNQFNRFCQATPILACFDPHFCCGLSPQAQRNLWATFRVRVQFGQISCEPTSWMGRMWVKRAWFGMMEFRGMCAKESKPFISFQPASLPFGYEI